MTSLLLLIGLFIPTCAGVALVGIMEGKHRVLLTIERIALGCMLGLLLNTGIILAIHIVAGVALSFALFASVHVASLIVCAACHYVLRGAVRTTHHVDRTAHSAHRPRLLRVIVTGLAAWVIVKAVLIGSVTLMMPAYYDDTLSNWNMRGKMYYVQQHYVLSLPNENPTTSKLGVSSYPPSVPLIKVWFAQLAGEWSEGVVNFMHLVWYLCALALVYGATRRASSHLWGLFAVYVLGSLPLYVMHSVTAYADGFMSAHVVAAVSMIFDASKAKDEHSRAAFLRLAALTAAVLPFTKNEGTMAHLPALLIVTVAALWWMQMRGTLRTNQLIRTSAWYASAFVLIALPWLTFKWMHGLTFGNGKPLSSLGIGWQENVVYSLFINTFFEGNWLFLFPLFLVLLAYRWKAALGNYAMLTFYYCIVRGSQVMIFLFTPLATEALRQTGSARGLIQVAPVVVVLVVLLLRDALDAMGIVDIEQEDNLQHNHHSAIHEKIA